MIKPFSFKEYLPRLKELFVDHWEEIASNKETRNLNVAEDLFISLEQQGSLLSLGAFVDEKLIGYSINIFNIDPHDKEKILCINDALYVVPLFRNGSTGIKLIKETEKVAKESGAYATIWHAKPDSSLNKLLIKLDYKIKDFLYMKEV